MSSRAPIQVPEEMKNQIEGMKSKFYAKTSYEVIEKLIQYYESNERNKAEERAKQQAAMIDVGPEAKQKFTQLMEQLGFTYPVNALELLMEHFGNSDQIHMATFDLFRKLRNGG